MKSSSRRIRQLISFGTVLGLMLIIFLFSTQPAMESKHVSNQFISSYQRVIRHIPFVSKPIKNKLLRNAGHYVRKAAHLTIYALLGALSLIAVWQLPISKKRAWFLALILCSLYAMSDEWHQYFVQGRGAQWSDVLLDSFGAFIGIVGICLARRMFSYLILCLGIERK